MIRDAIVKISERRNLSRTEAIAVMQEIVSGQATPSLIAAFLASLRTKGETVDEITGLATVMRENAVRIEPSRSGLVDTCGTGGDGSSTFNISTAASFVVAGAGVGVAKHGNRKVSGSCGSADVLESLGVEIELEGDDVARCIDEVGIGFLFAQKLHPAMRHAAGPRKELAMKTVMNVLGPISNPAGVKRQLIGVFDGRLSPVLVEVLAELGAESALVVKGEDGLDEISITGKTRGWYFDGKNCREITIDPEEYGFRTAPVESILARDVRESGRIFLSVLRGEDGPKRDIVVMNAAAALFVAGSVRSIGEGVKLAEESIDRGRAHGKFEELASFTAVLKRNGGAGR